MRSTTSLFANRRAASEKRLKGTEFDWQFELWGRGCRARGRLRSGGRWSSGAYPSSSFGSFGSFIWFLHLVPSFRAFIWLFGFLRLVPSFRLISGGRWKWILAEFGKALGKWPFDDQRQCAASDVPTTRFSHNVRQCLRRPDTAASHTDESHTL